jgi:hypothetical protein
LGYCSAPIDGHLRARSPSAIPLVRSTGAILGTLGKANQTSVFPMAPLTQKFDNRDDRTLAQRIEQVLPPGTQCQLHCQTQTLHVTLTADHHLNRHQTQYAIAPFLQHLPIREIHLSVFIHQETTPIWERTVFLQNLSNSPSPRIPAWLAEKPNLQTYHRLLAENFDLARLVGVIPFLVYGLFFARQYNVADFLEGTNRIGQFIHGANLIFHEAGHILFMPFGEFMAILGGSLNQILIPAIICGYFFVKGQRYASAVTLFWVGENFWDVSIYAKDADSMVLPLLGGNDEAHDWYNLLTILDWLPYTQIVGNLIYAIGSILYLIAIPAAFYFAQKRFAD